MKKKYEKTPNKKNIQPANRRVSQEDETNEPVNELKRIERIVMQELIV